LEQSGDSKNELHGGKCRAEEQSLLARARRGDSSAFAHLCEKYRQRVWRVVATVTRGGADTDDLAQEAIVRAWCAFGSYRGEASFESWLCRIALNAAHDYYRSAWRRRVFLWDRRSSGSDENNNDSSDWSEREPALSPSPHSEAERREVQQRIRTAVATLNARERVPIWLIYFEEFSLAEVARLEKIPESTVRSRVRAGLKRLERVLGDLGTEITFSAGIGHGNENSSSNGDFHSPALSTPRPEMAAVSPGRSHPDWKGCNI